MTDWQRALLEGANPRMWFALGSDGEMYILGDCGDFNAADEIAEDVLPEGTRAIWILDAQTAYQWGAIIEEGLHNQ